jgi:hypothetical protein
MKRILGEPLLHFLLLGAGLFIAYGLISTGSTAPGAILVSRGQTEHLEAVFVRTWQRPPTDAELKGLIDDWVREEIATREAMALGLDRDDTVIRRRLRQKLEFMSADMAAHTVPTDAELGAYLQAHPESFRIEPPITFSQVYLDPVKHGDRLARDAAQLLARLNRAGATPDLRALGDSFLLEPTFESLPASEIAKQFGEDFAAKLAVLPPGRWQGPIDSGYGAHLVLVSERGAGHAPELAEVRDLVRRECREWENARRLEESERFYQDLRKRYTVSVEGMEAGGQQKIAVTQ